jgi:lipopolysaccharide biosynthesis protein
MSHDFVGLTSSYENVYHLQSYFMCFGGTAIPAVVSYFKTHGLPFNHADAIGKYELGMSLHLTNLGLTSFALVTNNDMKRPLNTTCCKWSNVLEETGIVKRQNFLKKYAYAGMTDKDIAKIAENHAYNAELLQFLKCNNVRAFTPR